LCYKGKCRLFGHCKVLGKIMADYFAYSFYKVSIQCIVFEFTIDGRSCNTQLLHDARDRDTAAFNSFLHYFTLVRHRGKGYVTDKYVKLLVVKQIILPTQFYTALLIQRRIV
jgi:hypothetical protein